MLEPYSYLPLLYTKGPEILALEKLDKTTKSRILPILVVRPDNHDNLSDTITKLKDCAMNVRVALALDESKFGQSAKHPAREQFDALFDPTNGFANFFQFIEDWPSAIPTLVAISGIYENASDQIDNCIALDRGYLVRIRRSELDHFRQLLDFGTFDRGERFFVIDGEWARDILQLENWMLGVISSISAVYPDAEIVCISSSFPKDFTNIGARCVFSNDDRELFDRVRRNSNHENLFFGDWGSTRPSDSSIANKPRPRVDIPTERDWVSFRQRDKDDEGYDGVSSRATADRLWLETPDCWGKRLVELTALNRPLHIKGTHLATASRINIHVTVQAMSGQAHPLPEEPFEDNF